MTSQDILSLISADPWMMRVIGIAAELELPDWMIGAGFVRNKVWDHLHGYVHDKVPTADIDLIYFDPAHADPALDTALSKKMTAETGIRFEIVNQAYTHAWHDREPYQNAEDALADWVETATCVAVSQDGHGALKLHAPLGIEDLVRLIVRKNEQCSDSASYERRVASKGWKEKWGRLEVVV